MQARLKSSVVLTLNILQTPFLANMKPSGKYLMEDLFLMGGVLPLIRYLADNDMLHLDVMTCTGRTLRENLQGVEPM